MGMSAFNRARHQRAAIEDAKRRDDDKQMRDGRMMSPAEIEERARTIADQGTPPYPDLDRINNIPGDADLDRERRAMEQAMANRNRVPSPEERWELQNAHFRDIKTKAIPHPEEGGQDRTLKGQEEMRREFERPYVDERSPRLDGRVRASEPWEERPDSDTTVSTETVADPLPTSEDDDPATVAKLAEEGEKAQAERLERENAEISVTSTDDPAKAKAEGATAFVPATDPAEAPQGADAGKDVIPAKDQEPRQGGDTAKSKPGKGRQGKAAEKE